MVRLGNRYQIGDEVVSGDRTGRRPSIHEASDQGLFLFAKIWPRGSDSPDLRALWNHEARSLLRLGGYPRADEYFVRLKDLGTDDHRFYVILDAGERKPLSILLAQRNRHPWLRDMTAPVSRRRFWEGLNRVAFALAIMHGEGTLHRTLLPSGVFSDDKGECDFRLSGFEWSLRVSSAVSPAAIGAVAPQRLRAPELDREDAHHSIATDWFDFGALACELFGFSVNSTGANALASLRDRILETVWLSVSERRALYELLEPEAERRLAQSNTVLQAISEAQSSVRSRTVSYGRSLYVGLLLGEKSRLSEAIADVTRGKGDIHPSEVERQIDFIKRDIRDEPVVLIRQSPYPHYVVDGALLQYRIQQWDRNRGKTWEVGYCNAAEPPRSDPSERRAVLDGRRIEFRAAPRLHKDLQRARSIGAPWDAVFPFAPVLEPLSARQQEILDFFRLTNQLDALLTAAQVWPVVVANAWEAEDRLFVELSPHLDKERNALAINLNLPPTDEQMKEYFGRNASGAVPEDTEFTLSDHGILGREQDDNVRWRYDGRIQVPSGVRYRFYGEERGGRRREAGEVLYLMSRGMAGTVHQLKRRHRAIEAMRNHAGLLSAIADPAHERRDTVEEPGSSKAVEALDDSKKGAMAGIWCTQPIYTLQGPPGTGKTRLLETMVSHLLELDGSHQILITAHSHEAVDHVRRQLRKRISHLDPQSRPIVVRLDEEGDADHAINTARSIASSLYVSELCASAPEHLAARTKALSVPQEPGAAPSADARSFSSLVKQAANAVFATCNSKELSLMLEDSRRFDWSIMEEAGKAHGFDLAAALQASHRILMIGDQDQLPPFNFQSLENLFREPPRILNALRLGPKFAPGLMDRSRIRLDEAEQRRFIESCVGWLDMVQFFAEMYRRCEPSKLRGIGIATRLLEQHRMHPDIGDMISDCFYGKTLQTHRDAKARFASEPPPCEVVPGGWMPSQRIIFVNMPWVQEVKYVTGEEGGEPGSPRYRNQAEAEAVVRALSQFRPVMGKPCHLQVLSPYRPQVRLLTEMIAEEMLGGSLRHLQAEEFAMAGKRLGATVDEFQGSEADIVVVSLVRNNDERIGRGLGFLSDRRRVNVLLSRARHKLVIIGSWNFLSSRIDCSVEPADEEELAHIARLIRWLDAGRKVGKVARVSYERLMTGARS